MSLEFEEFLARADALGENPTKEQVEALLSWAIEHLDQREWASAQFHAHNVGDFYYLMSERMGECGI